ncbi:KNR4-like cell wall assembly/cell proliferation coordinating protein [Halogeometricum borinquense]|uniref:KNR4-like cell wall assembly/cell proliferation coordinating protein n=1 Tax=Halogeometricum borinquense TaxID=60847 RepID=A0A6C0UIU8_9EURY|nr:SMI1/KNR4 family protein [Halogeometricum borinquense]QIB74513.1 KNR4-like cell wall assembly/cell proliferation coordinating protein [Halogeometricum borinquense]
MNARWGRIREWFETHAPELTNHLRPGATDAEIRQAESTISLDFPPSVRASYRIHDGQTDDSYAVGSWRLFPLAEVVRQWEALRDIEHEFEFGDWDSTTSIPIMGNGGGDLLYVEHAPDESETPVTEWRHENPTHDVKAPSFAAYLDTFLDALDAGEYVYLEGDGVLVHEDDL